MARGNSNSVQQVLQRLRTHQLDDSCDGEEENNLQDEDFIPTYVAAGELSDSDTIVLVIQTATKTSRLHHLLLH